MARDPSELDSRYWLLDHPITSEVLKLYKDKEEITGRDIKKLFHKKYGSNVSKKNLELHAASYELKLIELGLIEIVGFELDSGYEMPVKFKLNKEKLREYAVDIFTRMNSFDIIISELFGDDIRNQ